MTVGGGVGNENCGDFAQNCGDFAQPRGKPVGRWKTLGFRDKQQSPGKWKSAQNPGDFVTSGILHRRMLFGHAYQLGLSSPFSLRENVCLLVGFSLNKKAGGLGYRNFILCKLGGMSIPSFEESAKTYSEIL